MGRGDDPHVGRLHLAPADAGELALLQHAQQAGLGVERHVADLVEEQRAAARLLELARHRPVGAGEGALLVAEELALDQVPRDRRHVDRDERPGLAQAVVVQRPRHQLLAGAALAGDHHPEVGVHQPRQDAVDLLHRRRAADQRQVVGLARRLLLGGGTAGLLVERLGDLAEHLLQVERLRQVLVGADLGGADRGHHRVLRAHHDDRQVGRRFLIAGNRSSASPSGIITSVTTTSPSPSSIQRQSVVRCRLPHPAAGAGQRLGEHGADRAVVVGDQDRAFHLQPSTPRRSAGRRTAEPRRPGRLSHPPRRRGRRRTSTPATGRGRCRSPWSSRRDRRRRGSGSPECPARCR